MCLSDVPAEAAGSVRELLQKHTLEEYLRQRPPSHVVTLDVNETVSDGLTKLGTYNILSAPLFDKSTGAYLGFLDRRDLLEFVLRNVEVRKISREELVYRLRKAGLRMSKLKLANVRPGDDGQMIYKANLRHTLLEVIRYGWMHRHGNGSVTHRVAVFEFASEPSAEAAFEWEADSPVERSDSESGLSEGQDQNWSGEEDERCPDSPSMELRVTSVISQSDVLRFLHAHRSECGPVMDMPVEALGLAHKMVVCVPCDMPTINAFATMDACDVSSVGIVDQRNGGCLVANLSASDLRGLEPQHFGVLGLAVYQFMKLRNARSGWPSKTVAGNNEWGLKGAENKPALLTMGPLDSLWTAVDAIVSNRVHRVYVVDENAHPLSIITITDVLRVLNP